MREAWELRNFYQNACMPFHALSVRAKSRTVKAGIKGNTLTEHPDSVPQLYLSRDPGEIQPGLSGVRHHALL